MSSGSLSSLSRNHPAPELPPACRSGAKTGQTAVVTCTRPGETLFPAPTLPDVSPASPDLPLASPDLPPVSPSARRSEGGR